MTFEDRLARRMLYSHVRIEEDGETLLRYLSSNFPRRDPENWRRQIEAGKVQVNEHPAECGTRLKRHDCVAYFPGEQEEPDAELHYQVLYEDSDLLVFNKPGDLCIHPTGPFFRHTLWHLAGEKYGELRFVHRLDRETSGLLAAARNLQTAAKMNAPEFVMHKEYLALVAGRFHGTIRARGFLEKDPESAVAKKKRFAMSDAPAESIDADQMKESADTELIEEKEIGSGMTLVRAIPHTGRQHQIRATLYSLGFPLIGDKLYGPDERIFLKLPSQSITEQDRTLLKMKRQALHSAELTFPHPNTGAPIHCSAPLPDDFLRQMEFEQNR